MATAQITPDKDAIVAEILVTAPPARGFEAISDPKQTAQWWGQNGMYCLTETKADVRIGGKWLSAGVGQDGKAFSVDGEYLEVDPPRLLVHTWVPSYDNSGNTIVRPEPWSAWKLASFWRIKVSCDGLVGRN